MSNKQDLLIEIGTEELPPKSLKRLASAFHQEICNSLKEYDLVFSEASWFATPRRLAVIIKQLDMSQPAQLSVRPLIMMENRLAQR